MSVIFIFSTNYKHSIDWVTDIITLWASSALLVTCNRTNRNTHALCLVKKFTWIWGQFLLSISHSFLCFYILYHVFNTIIFEHLSKISKRHEVHHFVILFVSVGSVLTHTADIAISAMTTAAQQLGNLLTLCSNIAGASIFSLKF